VLVLPDRELARVDEPSPAGLEAVEVERGRERVGQAAHERGGRGDAPVLRLGLLHLERDGDADRERLRARVEVRAKAAETAQLALGRR
jgi:hypothetical protein